MLLTGCGGFDRGDPTASEASDSDTVTDDAEAVSFATDVYSVLTQHCSSCHGSGGVAASSSFHLSTSADDDYDGVVALISVANPSQSVLLLRASGQSHSGGTVLTSSSTDYQLIESWITQGAAP